jgi:hypothetical protein
MSAPRQAGDLVDGVGSAQRQRRHGIVRRAWLLRSGSSPAEGRARFQAKLRRRRKMALATIQIFGDYPDCDITGYCLALPGHRAALMGRSFVFVGFVLRIGANRLTVDFALFAIRVKRAVSAEDGLCGYPRGGLRAGSYGAASTIRIPDETSSLNSGIKVASRLGCGPTIGAIDCSRRKASRASPIRPK